MNVLAFFAHPDDETILCGGILSLLAQDGARVHYLSATRGEGGELGEPPLTTIERLGEVREQELSCAVQALGGSSLAFLDYVDPRVGPENQLFPYIEDPSPVSARLLEIFQRQRIDAVITHGSNGEYGHPAHIVTHQAVSSAVHSLGESAPLFYTASASFPDHPRPFLTNEDDPAHLVVDVSLVKARKVQAAMCHRTQHALFTRKASEEAGHPVSVPEVIIAVEGLHRAWPETEGMPDDELARMLVHYAQN